MAKSVVILLALIGYASAAVIPSSQGKAAPFCNTAECIPPNCRCMSTDIPGGLTKEETPQVVLLTFDDAVNVLNFVNYTNLIFPRSNPNGCPVKATYFLSHEYNNYTLVNQLYNKGQEIAVHSITHRTNQDFWVSGPQENWEREMGDMRTMIEQYAGIPIANIKGARAPFLNMGGDDMWKALANDSFDWDCSWSTRNNIDPGLWPYTLDYRSTQDCPIGRCPTESYPGKWVVPMVDLFDDSGNPCAMVDTCIFPDSADAVYTTLNRNFMTHYNGNRSPFSLFIHAAWLLDANHLAGYTKFLDQLTLRDDVYIVSISQLIEWVKSPTPIESIGSFPPWDCQPVTPVPCTERRCSYPADLTPFQTEHIMSICTRTCPTFYPWYQNIFGLNPPTPWVP